MNWIQENKFLSGIIFAAIVILGGMGYLVSQKVAAFEQARTEYENQVRQLHTLQGRTPFPSKENLERTQAMVGEYRDRLTEFSRQLREMQIELDATITPQAFQDSLRSQVSEVQDQATAAEVTLPENFYLGFDAYRASLPSSEAAPVLARQLEAVRIIVDKLIEVRVKSIDLLARAKVPGESGGRAPAEDSVLHKTAVDVGFTGEQGRVRLALNGLVQLPEFAIIRAISVRNSQLEGPLRDGTPATEAAQPAGAAADPFQDASAPATMEDPDGGSEHKVILGREMISVVTRLDLLDFAELNLTD